MVATDLAFVSKPDANSMRALRCIRCKWRTCSQLAIPSLTPMDPQNAASNTHVPVVIDSPVFTGTFYDTSPMDVVGNATHNPTGQFTPDPVSEIVESMSFGFANFADHDPVTSSQATLPTSVSTQGNDPPMYLPTMLPPSHAIHHSPPSPSPYLRTYHRTGSKSAVLLSHETGCYVPAPMVQKRRGDDGPDERPSTKRPRHVSATEFSTRERYTAPPDPLMGLVPTITTIPDGRQLMNKTLKNTNNVYETVVLEEFHREQQSLATIPSANPGPNIQRCPVRAAKHVSNAKAGQKPKGAGKGRSAKGAAASRKSAACTWPVGIATGDKRCPE